MKGRIGLPCCRAGGRELEIQDGKGEGLVCNIIYIRYFR